MKLPDTMQTPLDKHATNISQWRHEWKLAPVVNSSLVDDPTVRQPGFNLPRRYWALLTRFQTNQVHCTFCQKRWGLLATNVPLWQMLTMSHCQQLPTVQAGGGCSDYTQLMTLLPNGWRHKCTRQQLCFNLNTMHYIEIQCKFSPMWLSLVLQLELNIRDTSLQSSVQTKCKTQTSITLL